MNTKPLLRALIFVVSALLIVGTFSQVAAQGRDRTAPSTPTNLAASNIQMTQATLTWTASTDNVAVTGYIIRRNGTQVGTVGAVTTYTNTGLTPNTAYSYTVAAQDAAGNVSSNSTARSVTTLADTVAPSAPTNLTSSNLQATQVTLNWTAATDNVAVTNYVVKRNGATIATLGAVTTYTNTGLTSNTAYSYTVSAQDASTNTSAASNTVNVTTPIVDTTAPSVPNGLAATGVQATQLTLNWSASTDNVGVTAYIVRRNGTIIATLGAVTTYTNTGLTPSTAYSYTVAARDAANNTSATSATLNVSTTADTTAPSAPSNLTSSNLQVAQVTLSWTASTDNVAVTGYTVNRNGSPIATLGVVTTYTNTGLTPSTAYSYTVVAKDAAGNSSTASNTVNITTLADTVAPSVPANLNATNVIATQVPLTWTASTDNVAVTNYIIKRGGAIIATVGAVTSYTDTTVSPLTTYSYTVSAKDGAGNTSANSLARSVTTPALDLVAPTAPASLRTSSVASGQIGLRWNASTDNVAVVGYILSRNGVALPTLITGITYTDTGLTPLTAYQYKVVAKDAAGNTSAFSNILNVTTTADSTPPTAPTNLLSSNVQFTQLTLTWTAATDNVAVTNYVINRDGIAVATVGAVTTYTDIGLTPGTLYSYTVNAKDAAGNISTASLARNVTTTVDTVKPTVPTGLTAAAQAGQVTLNWTASTDNVGVTNYVINRNGVALATVGAVTTYVDTTVAIASTYSYTVAAQDISGNVSANSTAASATVPSSPCTTSGPAGGTYTLTICIIAPADNATLTGLTPVTTSVVWAGGAHPSIGTLLYSLNGQYLLTDFNNPAFTPAYPNVLTTTFQLPSQYFVDGVYGLTVTAGLSDTFVTNPAGIKLTFTNGVTTPPTNANTFTPYKPVVSGRPLILAATGDGADGQSPAVPNRMASWNPDLVLYLGDVYNKGTLTEFYNWYGNGSTYFSQLNSKTNPIVGNHEYDPDAAGVNVAAGYYDYWKLGPASVANEPRSYYSYNAGGWHFIALNSNVLHQNYLAPGSAEYTWLANDLAANKSAVCTIAYFHHPPFNVGPEGYAVSMNPMWDLMVQNGVDVVMTGHDHDYQRWQPLGVGGVPSATGITEFVAGGGGHGTQQPITTDSRLVTGAYTTPSAYGALRMELNPTGMQFQYINQAGAVLDSGAIPCSGATDTIAPTAPANLTATSGANVVLNWTAATDATGIAGYTVYRNNIAIATTTPGVLSYTDYTVQLNQNYTYTIDAYDPANNHSLRSNAAVVSTPITASYTLNPIADSYVNEGSPIFNFGVSPTLRTDITPIQNSYLRFSLPAASGNIISASLRVFSNGTGTAQNGYTVLSTTGGWTETDITYGTAPALGGIIGASGTFTKGNWTTADVTAYVKAIGAGEYNLVMAGNDNAATVFASREDAVNPPQLVITVTTDAIPPSTPTNLNTSDVQGTQVTLNWTASTDNVGVAGYVINRNGLPVTTVGPVTTYTDVGLAPGTAYQYSVVAKDDAGNLSNQSNLLDVTTSSIGTLTVAATADGYVQSDLPDSNFGNTASFVTDLVPVQNAYLRFQVPAFAGHIANAQLQVYANSASSAGYTLSSTATGWTETGITYNNAPAAITSFGSSGAIALGTWTAVDVTSLVTAAGEYNFMMAANNNTQTSYSSRTGANPPKLVLTLTTDVVPPTAPTSLTTSNVLETQITLNWLAASDDIGVTSYVINRNGLPVGTVGPVTTYTDTGLNASTLYNYTVVARDGANNVSVPSNVASATTLDKTPPAVPSNVTGAVQATKVVLNWAASIDNVGVTGYTISRNSVVLATTLGTVTTYTDLTVIPDTTYQYTITAQDAAGNISAASTPLVVMPLSPATNLAATAVQSTQATLNWTASTSASVTGYIINRNGAAFATVGAVTTYTDTTLTADTIYQYTVTAQDAGGNTAAVSNSINVDTHNTGKVTLNPIADSYVDSASTTPFGLGTVLRTSTASGSIKNSYLRFQVPAFAGSVTNITLRVFVNPNTGISSTNSLGYTLQNTDTNWTEAGIISSNAPAPIGNSLGSSGPFTVPANTGTGFWTTINLTAAGITAGDYNFVMTGNSATTVGYSSREGANKPELVMTLSSDIVLPSTPANVTTTNVQETQLDLNWDASTDNVGVTGYLVNRNGAPIATLGAVTTYTDTGLTAGTAYQYTVAALDQAGNTSLLSAPVSVTTADTTAPTTPTNFAASSVQATQVTLTWTAATDNAAVTSYIISRDGVALPALGAVTTFTDTGLTEITAYQYTIVAKDAAGNTSVVSDPPLSVTTADATVPTTPANLAATTVQSTQIALTWSASTDNVAVTGYTINRNGAVLATGVAATTYTDSTVAANTAYTYTVTAQDAANNSSALSNSVNVNTSTSGTITLNPVADSYVDSATTTPNGSNTALRTSSLSTSIKNSYLRFQVPIVAGNITGATLRVFVNPNTGTSTTNSQGYTLWITSANWTEAGVIYSNAPASIGNNLGSSGAFTVPANTGTGFWTTIPLTSANITVGDYNLLMTGNSTTTVAYSSREGANKPELILNLLSDIVPPSTPANVTTANVQETQLDLNWTASNDNVGVTGYIVKRNGVALPTLGAVTTFTDTGLAPNTAYQYTVTALDAVGNPSVPSTPVSVTTADTTAPTAPTNLASSNVLATQVTLTWTAATDNAAVTAYIVNRNGAPVITLGAVTTYTDTSLTPLTAYQYTVVAKDAVGNTSALSNAVDVTTTAAPDTTPPSAPTGLAGTPDTTQIILNWTASTDNVGVTNYVVTRTGASPVTLGAVTTYTDTGLTSGTAYTYTVVAKDAVGNTSAPSTVNVSTVVVGAIGKITLSPTADTYIDQAAPTANNATNTALRISRSTTATKITYLRFVVPPLGGSVISATLKVFATTAVSPGYKVFSTVGGWTAAGLNWNTSSSFGPVGNSLGSSGVVAINTMSSVNVTALITAGGEYNLMMTAVNELPTTQAQANFASSENATSANRPVLEIVVNTPPTAVNDSGYSTNQNTPLTVAVGSGVLGNDSDVDAGTTLTAVKVSDPAHGTVTLNSNGSFTYTPAAGYSGSDSFTYQANDGKANSNTATVSITVNAVNTPPVAVNDSGYSTNQDTPLSVAVGSGVLVNDSDADAGTTLTAVLITDAAHGSVALIPNGAFTYTPAAGYSGSDSFTYKAFDGIANSNLATVSITVNVVLPPAPVAALTANVSNGTAPLDVTFTNISTGTFTSYSWNFGDGSAVDTTSVSPTHTYAAAGTYTASLTVSGPGGNDTATTSITVSVALPPAPTAAFTPSVTIGTASLDVTFTNASTGSISGYSWNFGDGSAADTSASPTHTFGAVGIYTVILTVSGPGGTDTATTIITVNAPLPPAPTAAFTPSVTTGDAPLSVTFTNASTGSISGYSWNFGDGSAADTSASPTHTFAAAGSYIVILTVSGPGGTDTATTTITVTNPPPPPPQPVANFTFSQTATPFEVQFTNTSTDATSYTWDFGDSATDTVDSPAHTYAAAGTYNVTLTANGPGGQNSITIQVTVN